MNLIGHTHTVSRWIKTQVYFSVSSHFIMFCLVPWHREGSQIDDMMMGDGTKRNTEVALYCKPALMVNVTHLSWGPSAGTIIRHCFWLVATRTASWIFCSSWLIPSPPVAEICKLSSVCRDKSLSVLHMQNIIQEVMFYVNHTGYLLKASPKLH